MTPKEIRDFIQKHARPCPCCGAALILTTISGPTSTGTAAHEAFGHLLDVCRKTGDQLKIVPVEEAEAVLISQGADRGVAGLQVRR
jgi:hypothetical protein